MAPFRSLAQKKFLYANEPLIAERWSREYPNQKKLPMHVKKKIVRKVDNKLKGSYGEADTEKKTIKINKKLHKRDGEKIIDTIVHEEMHLKHPKMHEKTVRKLTPKKLKRISKKTKSKLYSRYA